MTLKVQMANGGADSVDFVNATGTTLAQVKGYDDTSNNGHLELYTTASGTSTERVRVDSAGNVGIGTSSPTQKLDLGSGFVKVGQGVGGGGGVWFPYSSDALGRTWRARTDIVGYGDFGFEQSTTQTGTTFATKMLLDQSGNLLVGQTATGLRNSNSISIEPVSNNGAVFVNHASGSSSGNGFMVFGYNAGIIGSVTQNGTTGVLYNLTSDYRLKNDPQPLTGAKEFVMALQPKKWEWWDGSGEGVGFIAHEFMEVAKYSGHGEKDAVDENGNPVYQSIQPSSSEVMANLVSFIQEQQAIIQQLTARIDDADARLKTLEAK